MYQGVSVGALLLLGGTGNRFQSDLPKQFHRISGKELYLYPLETFIKTGFFDEILLLCHPQWIDKVKGDLKNLGFLSVQVLPGGVTRQQSSFLGISAAKSEILVIHDGVRPFVTAEMIEKNIQGAIAHGAVNTAIPTTDTLACSRDKTLIDHIPNRSHYWRGQTPQSFRRKTILKAHQQTTVEASTDDCSLILAMGDPVAIVLGCESNIKITTTLDLHIAEQILRLQKITTPSFENSLVRKTYALIGATGGIGQSIAQSLHVEGATVIPLSRHSSPYSIDLTKPSTIRKTFKHIYHDYGELDGLIYCAGFLKTSPLKKLSNKEIQEMIAVNLSGVIVCCKEVKIKKGGHIVNIASSSYSKGRKDLSVYSCTKAAVVNFTQALAEELPENYVNILVPSRTSTPMRKVNFPQEPEETLLSPGKVAVEVIKALKTQNLTGMIFEVKKDET